MKKILVTGGLGYVGSRLCPLLLEKNYEVVALDLALYGESGYEALKTSENWSDWDSKFKWIKGDIRDPKKVREAVKDCDAVIHLAAISNDPTGELDEVLTKQVNFDAVGLLLSISREEGVGRFINASSSSVFGIKDTENVTEELEPEPLTFYSKYKALAEWLVVSANSEKFSTVNVRPATVCGYSPRQRFDLTVNKLTADAIRKKVITVHGGEQRRPNIGITDMVNFYSHLLTLSHDDIGGRTFNFGFENNKVIDIAKIIQEELKPLDVEINVEAVYDNRDYHISSQKLVEQLNYKPISSIRAEVSSLKEALDTKFQDIDADEHYNMKTFKLDRLPTAYYYLSR